MRLKQTRNKIWYNGQGMALCVALALVVAAYWLLLRALDSGSLQQYVGVILLVSLAVQRLKFIFLKHKGTS